MKSVLSGLVLLLTLALSGCSGVSGARPSLPALMVERLDWMDDVALAKSIQRLPIHDPKREAELLSAMTQRGVAAGLKAENVRRFFTGQMEAAKVVQEEWVQQHPLGLTSYIVVPNLAKTIRPALDEIGRKMIERLAEPRSAAESAALQKEARRRLSRAGYSEAVMQPALEGLRGGLGLPQLP